ncbi:hypothetical protein CoNPh35_CDS0028 [Staphylococcus phage S-CoN_Ph35]|nr:hypothetical protein CoNPh35_CDS0028 [Staphylococcus phage S-CoN_Ph35]
MFKIHLKNQVQFTTQESQLMRAGEIVLREQPTLVQQAMNGVQLIRIYGLNYDIIDT